MRKRLMKKYGLGPWGLLRGEVICRLCSPDPDAIQRFIEKVVRQHRVPHVTVMGPPYPPTTEEAIIRFALSGERRHLHDIETTQVLLVTHLSEMPEEVYDITTETPKSHFYPRGEPRSIHPRSLSEPTVTHCELAGHPNFRAFSPEKNETFEYI